MKFVAGLLGWTAVSTILALVLGSKPSGLSSGDALAALLIGLLIGVVIAWKVPSGPRQVLFFFDWLVIGVFALAVLRSFLWLVVESGVSIRIGSPYNLGDLPLHWQMILHLVSGTSLWPQSLIFLEGPLRYPLGVNLWNALWILQGMPLFPVLVWSGLLGGLLAGIALWRWSGAFGMATLLFSGGLAGFTFFSGSWPPGMQEGIEWKNLFLTTFVTQRGFLWALPAGLFLLLAWKNRLEQKPSPLPWPVESLFYSVLPLFHLHSFLFFSLLLAACFLFAPNSKTRRSFLLLGLGALVPASLLVWLVTGGFSVSGGMAFNPGWMQGSHGWSFWWMNFGISLPLFIWLAVVIARKGDRAARIMVFTSLLILSLCFLVRFAPWAWDNVKLMIWVWMALAPFLWQRVFLPIAPAIRALLLFVLFFSGLLSLGHGLSASHSYPLVNRKEWNEARHLLCDLPPGSVVACKPDYGHPVALTGHRVALGYPGHLWSHGYDSAAALHQLQILYQNPDRAEVGGYLPQVTHLLVGDRERQFFGAEIWRTPPPGWKEAGRTESLILYEREDVR